MTTPFYADPARACAPENLPEHRRAWFVSEHKALTNRAKAICGGCPVRQPCLEYGLAHETQHVWGGVLMSSPNERRRARSLGGAIDHAIHTLWTAGLTDVAIALELNTTHGVIREYRRRHDLPGNCVGRPRKQAVAA